MARHLAYCPTVDTDYYEVVSDGEPDVTESSWGQRLTDAISAEIRYWRKVAGNVSTQELAERCTRLGHPIHRTVLANLENSRRATITVPELLIIAMALNVPPIVLLLPLGRQQAMEVAPGRGMAT